MNLLYIFAIFVVLLASAGIAYEIALICRGTKIHKPAEVIDQSCRHPKKTTRIFDATLDGQAFRIALHLCPDCRLVIQPDTPTITRLTPEDLGKIRASLTSEGYDVSALPNPDA